MASTNAAARKECHLPFWTPGSGHYGKMLGEFSRKPVERSTPLFLSFVDSVTVKKDCIFTIAEVGCGDGYATMPLIRGIIKSQCLCPAQLREKHGEDLAIQVIYEDQEHSDYNSLFQRLADPSSPFSHFSNVFPMATNVNFYKQCFPNGACGVIISSISAHWQENPDTTFKHSIFAVFATEEEQQRARAEAARDWTKFLTLRARELKSGGLCLILLPCIRMDVQSAEPEGVPATVADGAGKQGVHDGANSDELYGVDNLWDMERAWRELRDDKIITQEEYEQCNFNIALRTARDITLPFDSVTSPVRQAGLSLVRLDHMINHCPFKALWRDKLEKEGEDDRRFFADTLVNANRVWTRTTFRSSLSDMRSEEQKCAILEELYRRYKALVAKQNPETYRSDVLINLLVVRKM